MSDSISGRTPMLDIPWFAKSKCLAIADVVFVDGIGICSNQPLLNEPHPNHRLMDVNGNVHIVEDIKVLYEATLAEQNNYWAELRQNVRQDE